MRRAALREVAWATLGRPAGRVFGREGPGRRHPVRDRFYRWTLRLPNPPQRQRNVSRHDLHHVATGYGTDAIGEIEISAWEVGAGLGTLWIAWAISFPAFLWGLARYPSRTLRAYRKGRSCRSLFVDRVEYDALLELTIAELRARLGVGELGVSDQPAGLNRHAPRGE